MTADGKPGDKPDAAPNPAPDPAACVHCGDSLSGLKVIWREVEGQRRAYCCLGCAFVAEQLALARSLGHADDTLAAAVGGTASSISSNRSTKQVAPDVVLAHAQIEVSGMVCGACALLLEHQLRRAPGVAAAHVDYGARRAYLSFDPAATSVERASQVIERTGYRTGGTALTSRRAQRIETLRLLLAWLAMMQVMMLAVPAYVAEAGDIPPGIEQLLRIAQLILTVPVLLFSAVPILRAAVTQLRVRAIGMDLPIALGLGAAFVASAWATLTAQGAVYFDSITMFVALVLSARWLQARALAGAHAHIDAAHRLSGLSALRLRAYPDSTQTDPVAAEALAPGDCILVPVGEPIGADGVVRSGASAVSQAWLTGEATPIDKRAADAVLAGSVNLEQPLVIEVTRAGEATSLAALRRLVDEAGRERPRIVELANRVAVWFLWAVLAITAATVVGWWLLDPTQMLPNAIAVLVATCPCALSLAAPAALAAVQSALAQQGVLTARSAAIEQLARADVLACDKTGTLTEAEPVVLRVLALRGASGPASADAAAGPTAGPIAPTDALLAQAAALETLSIHPFARAIAGAAAARALAVAPALDAAVTPSAGIEATVAGERLRIGTVDFALGQMTGAAATDEGERVRRLLAGAALGAASVVLLADSQGGLAAFVLGEVLRPDARSMIERVRALGVAPMIVSGDRREPVQRIARALGIEEVEGVDGTDAAAGDDGAGGPDARGAVYAHQSPESKRRLIAERQAAGSVVAMLGDGMNDAPVIAQADVSIALASGSQLAQARADFIVLRPRLADVADAFEHARRGMRIVRQNLAWAAAYNLAIVPAAALGYVTPAVAAVGMAASSLLVVGNAMRARRLPNRLATRPPT